LSDVKQLHAVGRRVDKSNSNQVGTHSQVVEDGKGEGATEEWIEVDGK
jgi:hypothetical protein